MADLAPLMVTPEEKRILADTINAVRNARGGGGVAVAFSPGGALTITGTGKDSKFGGGAVIRRMMVKSIQNDYVTCRVLDKDDGENANDIYVAKPPELRHDKDWYPNTTALSTVDAQEVDVTVVGDDETWVLPSELEYTANTTQILAVRVGECGVDTTGGDPVLWMDLNIAGRVWIKDES